MSENKEIIKRVTIEEFLIKIDNFDLDGFITVKRIAHTGGTGKKVDVIIPMENGNAYQISFIGKGAEFKLFGATYLEIPYIKVYNREVMKALNGSVIGFIPFDGNQTMPFSGIRKLKSFYPYL